MKRYFKGIFCAPHGNKPLKFPWDIWNAVRFIFKYSILRELSFITLPLFPVSGNQIAYFSEWAAHLISTAVSRRGQNHEKSQSKIDQDFGRNRKTVETGGYCQFAEDPNLKIFERCNFFPA